MTEQAPERTEQDQRTAAATRLTKPHQVIRARDHTTGDHYTTTRHLATMRGDTILQGRPAVDRYGAWLPRKPHLDLTPEEPTTTTTEDAPLSPDDTEEIA